MKRLALLLALAGCTVPADPVVPVPVPDALKSCPAAPATPSALPAVVTPDRFRTGYADMDTARKAERKRGDACASKLQQLLDWITR